MAMIHSYVDDRDVPRSNLETIPKWMLYPGPQSSARLLWLLIFFSENRGVIIDPGFPFQTRGVTIFGFVSRELRMGLLQYSGLLCRVVSTVSFP